MEATGSNRKIRYLVIVLVLGIAVTYVWKEIAVRAALRQAREQRTELIEASRRSLTQQTDDMLKLAAIPLGWAVRSEALRDNYSQVDDYLSLFVKQPFVNGILLVGSDGVVRIATDKKLEGQDAGGLLPADLLQSSATVVVDAAPGDIQVIVPVMGYDARLGTLVLNYSRDAIESRVPEAETPGTEKRAEAE